MDIVPAKMVSNSTRKLPLMHERQNLMRDPESTEKRLRPGNQHISPDFNLDANLGTKFFLRQGKILKSQQSKYRKKLPGLSNLGKGIVNDKVSMMSQDRTDHMATAAWGPKVTPPLSQLPITAQVAKDSLKRITTVSQSKSETLLQPIPMPIDVRSSSHLQTELPGPDRSIKPNLE